MDDTIDELRLAAWRAFINAHASVIERIEAELAQERQLPLTSYDVLVALAESPERRLRMHELADRIVLSRSGLTRMVDRLEAEGLLRRERSGSDRRGAYAVLTEGGHMALDAARPIYARGINTFFAGKLSDAEIRTITEALVRVDAAARTT
jgi:DNA-binding MarR family transcriptional regulator